ncbi:MAG TPA: YciI family protein [Thermoanaerobaculia bacterium]|nr:YciI family protein [Thermoanaerobaculia bacterium]
MKYLLLIYDDPKVWASFTEEEVGKYMGEYRALSQAISESGQMLSGAQLQPVSTATSVQVREGKRLVHDGPFAETREVLGGFYLVEAKDLDEAIGIAARIPSAKVGTIEVRPLVERG